MSSEGLPDAVKRFIRAHIQTVEQIEILALVRNAPEREWTAARIDQVLRSSERSIAQRLVQFTRAGLLAEVASAEVGSAELVYQYRPRDSALNAAAAETVQAYRTRPVLVIETIFKPEGDAAQSFADAFRIRPR